MDEYPQGCNALVAVISYTGYDMEDAMIINKAAYERGFGHGSVYKTFVVDLEEVEKQVGHNFTQISPQPVTTTRISPHSSPQDTKNNLRPSYSFSNIKKPPHGTAGETDMIGDRYWDHLDSDGLPEEGTEIQVEIYPKLLPRDDTIYPKLSPWDDTIDRERDRLLC